MSETIKFQLDGKTVEADPGETIWQVAKRHDTVIPHLCYKDAPGYRPDGNCRACMVEVEGEREERFAKGRDASRDETCELDQFLCGGEAYAASSESLPDGPRVEAPVGRHDEELKVLVHFEEQGLSAV